MYYTVTWTRRSATRIVSPVVTKSPAFFERPTSPALIALPSASRRRGFRLRRLLRNRTAFAGMIVLLITTIAAAGASFLAPYDPNAQSISIRLQPPLSTGHLLGTDQLGRDILSRLLFGGRVSLIVGLTTVAIGGLVGITLGLVSGYYLGWLDDIISWLINVQLAFPFFLLMIAVVAVFGASLRTLIIVMGIGSWVVYARVLRGMVLTIKEREYVQAARAIGTGQIRILFRHVLPNAATPLIVIASFEVARMIILEAALSYLGLGAEPSIPSWGAMLADGRAYIALAWWLPTLPGFAIMFTVLGINLVGDWLRDELDPRSSVFGSQ